MPRKAAPEPEQITQMQRDWANEDLERAIARANTLRRVGFTEEAKEFDLLAANARNRITRLSMLEAV